MTPTLADVRIATLERPDGARIVHEVGGSGPALVFAHGLGGNHTSWFQQVPAFIDRHRVVTFSHRGFGPSSAPGGTPDPADYAGDLIALLDHLGIERAVVVAQSMGGWTAVEAALSAPGRIAGIVFACTTGPFDYDGLGDPAVAAWREGTRAKGDALRARRIHVAAGARLAEDDPALMTLYHQLDRLNAGLDKDRIGKRLREMRVRGAADAARLGCPALFVAGEEDIVICPRGLQRVAAMIPGARYVEVPASGHSVYFERAAMFNTLVRRFLDDIGWR